MIEKTIKKNLGLFTSSHLDYYILQKKRTVENHIKQSFYLGNACEFTPESFYAFIDEKTKEFFIQVDLQNIVLLEKTQDYAMNEMDRMYAYPVSGDTELLEYSSNGIMLGYNEFRDRFGKVEINTTQTHLFLTISTSLENTQKQTKQSLIACLKDFHEYVAIHVCTINNTIAKMVDELKSQYHVLHSNLQFEDEIVDIMKHMKM